MSEPFDTTSSDDDLLLSLGYVKAPKQLAIVDCNPNNKLIRTMKEESTEIFNGQISPVTETEPVDKSERRPHVRIGEIGEPESPRPLKAITAAAMIAGGGYLGNPLGLSSFRQRKFEPQTANDLERIQAAKEKRERKAAKKLKEQQKQKK